MSPTQGALPLSDSTEIPLQDDATKQYIAREKSSYILQAARSVTATNLVVPVLCFIVFEEEVQPLHLWIWMGYMLVATMIRTVIAARLEREPDKIVNPQSNLNRITLGVGLIGLGWGMGWWLLVPDLSLEHRFLYLYITMGGLFNSMFAYCVHWPTFYSFTLPFVLPAIAAVLSPARIFHWSVSVGLVTLFFFVLKIARNFSKTYEDSLRLRLRNERLYQDLAAERDASLAANIAKSNFIAVASHDLRQPLHATNIYLEALHMDRIDAGDRETILKIKSSVTVLNDMFEALLNISRLDSFSFRPINRDFRVSALQRWLNELARPLAEQRQLTLHIEGIQGVVHGDIKLLQQIAMNLLSNAIYYTEQGAVEVEVGKARGCLKLEVRDTGCGITPGDQAKIFDEFFRVDRTRSLHDGLGLGLSIVKRLCSLIGARIELESVLGRGTRFSVYTAYPVREDEELNEVVLPSQLESVQG